MIIILTLFQRTPGKSTGQGRTPAVGTQRNIATMLLGYSRSRGLFGDLRSNHPTVSTSRQFGSARSCKMNRAARLIAWLCCLRRTPLPFARRTLESGENQFFFAEMKNSAFSELCRNVMLLAYAYFSAAENLFFHDNLRTVGETDYPVAFDFFNP